jgi:uncharacterized membrane protein YoaK (UPF0700 family)
MGLSFLMKTTYLLPLTAMFLVIAVASLAFRARRRRGYGPFVVGLAAAAMLLAGKFILESNPAMYASAGLLFAASVWNAWPRRTAKSDSATPTESLYQIGSNEGEVQP